MQSISKDVRTVPEATRFRHYHDAFFLTQQFAHVALFRLIKDECSRSRFDMNLGRSKPVVHEMLVDPKCVIYYT